MTEYINWIALLPILFFVPVLPYVRTLFENTDVSKFAYGAATLGILLTFYGIWRGLLGFDITNTEQSIPILIDGLKIAFGSSLTGLGTSMLINLFFVESKDDVESSLEKAVHAIEELKDSLDTFTSNTTQAQTESLMNAIHHLVKELEMGINSETKVTMTKFRTSVEFLREWQEKYVDEIKHVTEAMDKNAQVTIATSKQLELTNSALDRLGPATEQLKNSVQWVQSALPSTRPRPNRNRQEVKNEK
jgi:predicted DNA-binding protein